MTDLMAKTVSSSPPSLASMMLLVQQVKVDNESLLQTMEATRDSPSFSSSFSSSSATSSSFVAPVSTSLPFLSSSPSLSSLSSMKTTTRTTAPPLIGTSLSSSEQPSGPLGAVVHPYAYPHSYVSPYAYPCGPFSDSPPFINASAATSSASGGVLPPQPRRPNHELSTSSSFGRFTFEKDNPSVKQKRPNPIAPKTGTNSRLRKRAKQARANVRHFPECNTTAMPSVTYSTGPFPSLSASPSPIAPPLASFRAYLPEHFLFKHLDAFKPFLHESVFAELMGNKSRSLSWLQYCSPASAHLFPSPESFSKRCTIPLALRKDLTTVLTEQPACIQNGVMHYYQLDGLNWLISRHDYQIGGILADDMGLGKTLQMISFLGYLKHERKLPGPHLIVCPLSVLPQWVRELNNWCPSLSVLKLHGTKEQRKKVQREDIVEGQFDVLVTTFEMALKEKDYFQTKISWQYLIIDEAHIIKNEESAKYQALQNVKRSNSILMTGTPLQNNMRELWALLRFLFPRVFVSPEPFVKSFDLANETFDVTLLAAANRLLEPIRLQRKKATIEHSLPSKTETKIYIPLTRNQSDLYQQCLSNELSAARQYDDDFLSEPSQHKSDTLVNQFNTLSAKRMNSLFMQLRQLCNHPLLLEDPSTLFSDSLPLLLPPALRSFSNSFSPTFSSSSFSSSSSSSIVSPAMISGGSSILERSMLPASASVQKSGQEEEIDIDWTSELNKIVKSSSKMQVMDKLLQKLFLQNHRVLIFSQFTKMLNILERYCQHRGWYYLRLDGSTKRIRRNLDITRFNAKNSAFFIYLISTRAGGLGINLTTADTVIHYDSDFNPQVDAQAQDRVHRIGQTKPVHIYRLITQGTVEERLILQAEKKLFMDVTVNHSKQLALKAPSNSNEEEMFSKSDLLSMLTFGADRIFKTHETDDAGDINVDLILSRSSSVVVPNLSSSSLEHKENPASSSSSSSFSPPSSKDEQMVGACTAVALDSVDKGNGSSSQPKSGQELLIENAMYKASDFNLHSQSLSIREFKGKSYEHKKLTAKQQREKTQKLPTDMKSHQFGVSLALTSPQVSFSTSTHLVNSSPISSSSPLATTFHYSVLPPTEQSQSSDENVLRISKKLITSVNFADMNQEKDFNEAKMDKSEKKNKPRGSHGSLNKTLTLKEDSTMIKSKPQLRARTHASYCEPNESEFLLKSSVRLRSSSTSLSPALVSERKERRQEIESKRKRKIKHEEKAATTEEDDESTVTDTEDETASCKSENTSSASHHRCRSTITPKLDDDDNSEDVDDSKQPKTRRSTTDFHVLSLTKEKMKTANGKVSKRFWTSEKICYLCKCSGVSLSCHWCPHSYHPECLGLDPSFTAIAWNCPHHTCAECHRNAPEAGGMLFRCAACPCSYCEDHVPQYVFGRLDLDHCLSQEAKGYAQPSSAFYILCSSECVSYYVDTLLPPVRPRSLPHASLSGSSLSSALSSSSSLSPSSPSSLSSSSSSSLSSPKTSSLCISAPHRCACILRMKKKVAKKILCEECKTAVDIMQYHISCLQCNLFFHGDCAQVDESYYKKTGDYLCIKCEQTSNKPKGKKHQRVSRGRKRISQKRTKYDSSSESESNYSSSSEQEESELEQEKHEDGSDRCDEEESCENGPTRIATRSRSMDLRHLRNGKTLQNALKDNGIEEAKWVCVCRKTYKRESCLPAQKHRASCSEWLNLHSTAALSNTFSEKTLK